MSDTNGTILIAEDELPLAKALAMKLESAGYTVTAVTNGSECLAELKAKKYDMLLLDLIMPETDGFAVLEELKSRGTKIPTIVLSNLGQEEDIERAKSLGAKDYFIKADTSLSAIVDMVRDKLKD
ncbi:MAG TPA: response regulator [Candidatus Paceibacterota bacterium]|nr:response regulator [Candidatus Paceibacterota bacterium]